MLDAAWGATLTCAEGLEAPHVVVHTPVSFTPGSLHRRRIERFAERVRGAGRKLIWEPTGLWEATEVRHLAEEHGFEAVLPAFDGRDVRDAGRSIWLAVGGGGAPAQTPGFLLDQLAEALLEGEIEPAGLVFAGPTPWRSVKGFHRALQP